MRAYKGQKLQDAIKYFRRAAQSEKSVYFMSLASVLSEAGEYQESNQIFLKLVRSNPELEQCYYFIANNYAYMGLFQQAKKYADRYLEFKREGIRRRYIRTS